MHAVIALVLIPLALSGREMIGTLWLKAATPNKFATVGLVCMIRVTFLKKDRLDKMISFIVGTINPDAFCLVDGWYGHHVPPV
jgi:hypothetical protein